MIGGFPDEFFLANLLRFKEYNQIQRLLDSYNMSVYLIAIFIVFIFSVLLQYCQIYKHKILSPKCDDEEAMPLYSK
jgi:hypothetical protein